MIDSTFLHYQKDASILQKNIEQQRTRSPQIFIKIHQTEQVVQNYPLLCELYNDISETWSYYELKYSSLIGYYYQYQATAPKGSRFGYSPCPEGVPRR